MNKRHRKIFADILSLPTAPFHEGEVVDHIRRFCERRSLALKEDRFGNLVVRYRRGRRAPVALTAHTDHPGFSVTGGKSREITAEWLGGCDPAHFPGSRVNIVTKEGHIQGTVDSRLHRNRRFTIRTRKIVGDLTDAYGYWHLPPFEIDGDRIVTKAADNLAGCAAILCAIETLHRTKANADLWAIFTRAEEVGLIGAAGVVEARTLPKRIPIVVLEASKELPGAKIGDGPVIRVGDRMSVFDPAVECAIHDIAQRRASKTFKFQRQLMSGGVCEASIYVLHGYRVGALAFPLGNYHNQGHRRPAPESISMLDAIGMVELCRQIALQPPAGDTWRPLRTRFERRFNPMKKRLLASR